MAVEGVEWDHPELPALVMAGGRARRMGGVEKPAVEVLGEPMLVRVLRAVSACRLVSRVYVVTTPHHELTRELAESWGAEILLTRGKGYVRDLREALSRSGAPALTVGADLPALTPGLIERVIRLWAAAPDPSLSVWVPVRRVKRMGFSLWGRYQTEVGGVRAVPAGINVVGGVGETSERKVVIDDPRLACNVNTATDLRRAEGVLNSWRS